MKKFIWFSLFAIVVLLLSIYSCRDNGEQKVELKENLLVNESMLKRDRIPPLTTLGGKLIISQSEINKIYNLSNANNIQNLRDIVLYTIGNENGKTPIKLENLKGLSIFHYNNNKLQHSFYKKTQNGNFVLEPDLTLNCFGVTQAETDFVAFYSNIYKGNNLTVYSIRNNIVYNTKVLKDSNNPLSDYISSYELFDMRAAHLGNLIKLSNKPSNDEEFNAIQSLFSKVPCYKCGEAGKTGDCEVDGSNNNCVARELDPVDDIGDGGDGGGIDDPKICAKNRAQNTLGDSYNSFFIDEKLYGIRDEILVNSLIGMKYYNYYYQTSFYNISFSFSDAQKIAYLLPKIYVLYNNILENNSNEIIFDIQTSDDIIEILESLKVKNANNTNLVTIFDDVKNDLLYLKNKTIKDLNENIY